MSVHRDISKHSEKQHQHVAQFLKLDAMREAAIEKALQDCKAGLPFHAKEINRITAEINLHAKQGISPTRQLVTEDMIRAYAETQYDKTEL
jgi:predicted transcriptional regulator